MAEIPPAQRVGGSHPTTQQGLNRSGRFEIEGSAQEQRTVRAQQHGGWMGFSGFESHILHDGATGEPSEDPDGDYHQPDCTAMQSTISTSRRPTTAKASSSSRKRLLDEWECWNGQGPGIRTLFLHALHVCMGGVAGPICSFADDHC